MTLHPTERARRQVEAELGRTSALLAEKTQELEMTLASVAQGVIKVDAQGHVRGVQPACAGAAGVAV